MGKTAASKKSSRKPQTKASAKKNVPQAKTRPIRKQAVAPTKATPKTSPKVVKKVAPAKKAAPPKPFKKAVPAKTSKKVAIKDTKVAKAPKAPKAPKASGPKGYTAAQYEKFKELKKKFEGFSNQALKDLLRKNMQSMTGNKDDLVYKCADGAILGKIPRCPKCFGGRPKFDFNKGTYYCSGYRDDEDFKNCHSTFQLGEITRDTWQD